MPALEVSEVCMAFGGAQVLSDVSLSVAAGGVTGLIGPNGAGKTTLFNVVSGLLEPRSGRVMIDGHDVTKAGPAARARRGLSRTYQRLELFTSLTVGDNIRVAGEIRNTWGRRGRIDVGGRDGADVGAGGSGRRGRARGERAAHGAGPGGRGGAGPDDPAQGAPARRARLGADRGGDAGLRTAPAPARRGTGPGHLPGRARRRPRHGHVRADPRPRLRRDHRQRPARAGQERPGSW